MWVFLHGGHEWCPCPIAERKVWVPAVMKQRIIPLRLKDKPCFVAWPGSLPHMGDSLGHAVTLLPSGHCWDSFSSYILVFSSSTSLELFFNIPAIEVRFMKVDIEVKLCVKKKGSGPVQEISAAVTQTSGKKNVIWGPVSWCTSDYKFFFFVRIV